jgi:hypothetical protein
MFLFTVTERFGLRDGMILLPGLVEKYVPVGTPITIIRPDKIEIETRIVGINFGSNHIMIEKSVKLDDVPIGSEVWAKKSITYDLTYNNLVDKKLDGADCEIIFQHKGDLHFFITLKLSGVVGIIDNLKQNETPVKLRIDKVPGSYANDLSIQLKNEEIKTYPEVLIFSDKDCVNVIFRSVAKDITYSSKRDDS